MSKFKLKINPEEIGMYYCPYIPTNIILQDVIPTSNCSYTPIKKEEKMDISPEEFNKTIKAYYDNFSEHWDKALNAYEKLVINLGLPETPIKSPNEGRWFEENAECCGEVPSMNIQEELSQAFEPELVISDFVRDTFNYYGASNLFAPITYYHRFYTELCNLLVTGEATDIDPKKELNDIMANEAKWKKAEREKIEKSEPLWNALKVS